MQVDVVSGLHKGSLVLVPHDLFECVALLPAAGSSVPPPRCTGLMVHTLSLQPVCLLARSEAHASPLAAASRGE